LNVDISLTNSLPHFKNLAGNEIRHTNQIILIVARMWASQREKGHDELILSMQMVKEKHPEAQLVIVGQGDDMSRLKRRAHSLNVTENVCFTGFISHELRDALYANCAIFAMPSRQEGFGLVFLEAMRWAKPCIGCRAGAIPEVIIDGKTGFLLDDPIDIHNLSRLIIAMLDNPQLSRELGIAGLQRLKDNFTYPHFKKRFYKALGFEL
jgi:phosphatidyl-myo-inositol dimannoside synthase